MPASSWFGVGDGSLETQMVLAQALEWAILTSAPPGHEVVPTTMSVNNLRPPLPGVQSFIARGRVVNSGPRFTVVEVQLEDAVGRPVAHATGSALVRPMDPPPPGPFSPGVSEEPSYATPDPHLRPLSADAALSRQHVDQFGWLGATRKLIAGELPTFPIFQLLGIRAVELDEGRGVVAMRTSDWHRTRSVQVANAVLAGLGRVGLSASVAALARPGFRIRLLDNNLSFLRPAIVDGRELISRSAVVHDADPVFVSTGEIIDADGAVLAVGRMTALLSEGQRPRESGLSPERVLATVLFTDLVDSTRRAEEIGDAAWSQLLAEHHAVVRRQLETWKGREVKTTGDGFLATFDSPARALQCARGIRDAVGHLGLQVRAGVHTGECEVSRRRIGAAVHGPRTSSTEGHRRRVAAARPHRLTA